MSFLKGPITVSRFQIHARPDSCESALLNRPFTPIPLESTARLSAGVIPIVDGARLECCPGRFAFKVRIDTKKPDKGLVKDELRILAGEHAHGDKELMATLRARAEEIVLGKTSAVSRSYEVVIDGSFVYIHSVSRNVLCSILGLLFKCGFNMKPLRPWPQGDLASDLYEPRIGSTVYGARFLKWVIIRERFLPLTEKGRFTAISESGAKINCSGNISDELDIHLHSDAEFLVAKGYGGGFQFTLNGPSLCFSGIKKSAEEYWEEKNDERLCQVLAAFQSAEKPSTSKVF